MQYDFEKTRKSPTIERLQNDVEKLRDNVRCLEFQISAIADVNLGKIGRPVETVELPYPATGKFQRCKNCTHVRLPHKSNPHYTCDVQHASIEPTWICAAYCSK
jgi:hypothetical protein